VLQQITETLGPDAVSQLAAYDQETKKLEESYQKAYSALARELLPAMLGFVTQINNLIKVLDSLPPWIKNLGGGLSRLSEFATPVGGARIAFESFQALGEQRAEGVTPTAPEESPEFQKRQRELQQAAEQRKIALRGQSQELQAQLDLLNSGLDITTDKGFELAKQVVVVKYLAELEEINNSKLEKGEKILRRQVALLQQRIGISNLQSQRNRALQSAASRAASAGASAAREAEARQKQIDAARISELNLLKERFAYSVKNAEYEKGEIAALEERVKQLALERDGQLEIAEIKYRQSALNAKSEAESNKLWDIYKEQYNLIMDQYNLQNKLTDLKIKQLKIEEDIAALQRTQTATNTRRELEQELSRLTLPNGNLVADAFDAQRLEQLIRFENTLRNINDQIEILEKRQAGTNGEAFAELDKQIKGLRELQEIYGTLLPQIFAAEKQQLAYNQALSFAQGPVSNLVGGLREVAAGTKSVEQAFADFLNGLADQLAQTAAQMIAQYIAIGIARKFAGIATGGGGDGGGGLAAFTGGFTGSADPSTRFGLLPTSNIPFRANGGPVSGGSPYVVGEKGPELFVPGRSGSIVPNGAMAGETVVNITVNSNGSGNTASRGDNSGETTRLAKMIEASTLAIINREKRPGGALR
jgi:hypothetical protein